jgi:hypothetical protein
MYWPSAGTTVVAQKPLIAGGRPRRDVKPPLTTLTMSPLKKIVCTARDTPTQTVTLSRMISVGRRKRTFRTSELRRPVGDALKDMGPEHSHMRSYIKHSKDSSSEMVTLNSTLHHFSLLRRVIMNMLCQEFLAKHYHRPIMCQQWDLTKLVQV